MTAIIFSLSPDLNVKSKKEGLYSGFYLNFQGVILPSKTLDGEGCNYYTSMDVRTYVLLSHFFV